MEGKIIYNMFSQTNPELHAREKRPIAKYYTMNGVLPLEPHIDVMINYFGQRLEEEFMDGANAGKTCDLGRWLLYCMIHILPIKTDHANMLARCVGRRR